MKKGIVVLVLVILNLFQNLVVSQIPTCQWAKQSTGATSGAQDTYGIITDASGNVYATGDCNSSVTFGSFTLTSVHTNVFIVKYDANGNTLWAKKGDGGIWGSVGNSIATDALANVYVTGTFSKTVIFDTIMLTNSDTTGNTSDMFLVKYDSNGNLLWAKSAGGVGNDKGISVATDTADNVIISGTFMYYILFDTIGITSLGTTAIFFTKYDSNGNVIWAKNTIGTSLEFIASISTDGNNNIYATGTFYNPSIAFDSITLSTGTNCEMFIVKYDANGNVLWAKSAVASPPGVVNGSAITNDKQGNAYVAGNFISTTVFGSFPLTCYGSLGYADVFIIKYDSIGNVIWARKAGGIGLDEVHSVTSDTSGIYLTGRFRTPSIRFGSDTLAFPSGSYDPMFFVKYDLNGNEIFAFKLTSGGDDIAPVITDGFGNIYLAGDYWDNAPLVIGPYTLSLTGANENFFIAKYGFCTTTPPVITSIGNNTLQSSLGNTYQWYFNGVLLIGDTLQTLFVTQYGNYSVVVTDQYGCYGSSDNYIFSDAGIKEISQTSITIFPNPTTSSFTVTSTINIKSLKVYDVLGSLVRNYELGVRNGGSATIDITGVSKGIYFVEIKTDAGVERRKIVKE